MGKIVVTEFVSMDGVMQAPGGEDFKYPGWTFEFDRGDDGNQFKLEELEDAAAHLLGRVTYESFAGAWPDREGPFADKLNADPKYLVSSTISEPEWNNTTVIDGSGDVIGEVKNLKDDVDGNILVSGSRRLVQDLLEHDLVDELRLMVFPLVLGTGDRVFDQFSDRKDFRLLDHRTVGSDGVFVLHYERKGA